MSCNEFHKGKLHKLTRGMSETKNKVKELAKQDDVPVDEDEDDQWLSDVCWDIYEKSGVKYVVVNKRISRLLSLISAIFARYFVDNRVTKKATQKQNNR